VSLFEPVFEALNGAQVRYVVVGGFATVLHGHARLTADIDLVIDRASREG
jgi:ABC-type tungstate transport system permease subunit